MRLSKDQSNIRFVGLPKSGLISYRITASIADEHVKEIYVIFRLQTLDQERNVHSVTILS